MQSPRKPSRARRALTSLGLVLVLAAALPVSADEGSLVWDPWEPLNRKTHGFNEWVDYWVLEPIATAYDFVVPERAQRSVANFFVNLAYPARLANSLLQLKFVVALEETGRFLSNSTVGVGGLFDVASDGGFPKHTEDFGQTLGYWGVPPGPFLVIPLLGPSNVRDAVGLAADTGLSVHGYFIPFYASAGMFTTDKLNQRSRALETLAAEREAAFDFYAFTRGAYSQFRENQVRDRRGESAEPESDVDQDDLYYFEEEDYDDDEEF